MSGVWVRCSLLVCAFLIIGFFLRRFNYICSAFGQSAHWRIGECERAGEGGRGGEGERVPDWDRSLGRCSNTPLPLALASARI